MGFPSPAEDHADKDLSLDEYLIVRPAATFYWRFAGHDMERAGLINGALLVVDKSLDARQGDVVVARHLGAWLVRTLRGRHLVNAPMDEEAVEIKILEDTIIWGVVTHSINTLRVGSVRSDRYGDLRDGQG